MNPFDVVKQRMQAHGSQLTTVAQAFKTVYRTEGLSAFYVSYPTTLTMTVPFTAVQFSTYEFVKCVFSPSRRKNAHKTDRSSLIQGQAQPLKRLLPPHARHRRRTRRCRRRSRNDPSGRLQDAVANARVIGRQANTCGEGDERRVQDHLAEAGTGGLCEGVDTEDSDERAE